jgi:hypothetical protein
VSLRRDCSFRSRVTFHRAARLGSGRLRFDARFFGNRVLRAVHGRARVVRARL